MLFVLQKSILRVIKQNIISILNIEININIK